MLRNHCHLVLAVSEFLNLVNGPWLLPPKLIAREGYDTKCLSVVLFLEVLQLTIVDIRKPTIRCYVYYQKHLEVSAVSVSMRVPISYSGACDRTCSCTFMRVTCAYDDVHVCQYVHVCLSSCVCMCGGVSCVCLCVHHRSIKILQRLF